MKEKEIKEREKIKNHESRKRKDQVTIKEKEKLIEQMEREKKLDGQREREIKRGRDRRREKGNTNIGKVEKIRKSRYVMS